MPSLPYTYRTKPAVEADARRGTAPAVRNAREPVRDLNGAQAAADPFRVPLHRLAGGRLRGGPAGVAKTVGSTQNQQRESDDGNAGNADCASGHP